MIATSRYSLPGLIYWPWCRFLCWSWWYIALCPKRIPTTRLKSSLNRCIRLYIFESNVTVFMSPINALQLQQPLLAIQERNLNQLFLNKINNTSNRPNLLHGTNCHSTQSTAQTNSTWIKFTTTISNQYNYLLKHQWS